MAPRLTFAMTAAVVLALATGCSASGKRPDFGPPPNVAAFAPIAVYDLNRLDAAIHRYAADRAGRLPTVLDALADERAPGGDTYLLKTPTTDPWGGTYVYAVLDARLGTFDLRSYGPDRLPGTDDDVVARADPIPLN